MTDWAPTHRHRNGGLYQIRHKHALIEATMTPAVVYEGQDGTLLARRLLGRRPVRYTGEN